MAKPHLSNLASIAEIGAAIVVVISLFFIYRELEQNTLSTQDASYQQFLTNLTELDLAESSNAELATIIATGETDPASLSKIDRIRFTKLASGRIAQFEYAYISRANGTMSDAHWQAVEPHIQYLFCQRGYRKFLDSGMDQIYANSFLKYLNESVYPLCQ